MTRWSLVCIVATVACARAASPPADLIVTGVRVYTVDSTAPNAEALVVRGDRLVFVGSAQEALRFRGPATRVVSYPGRTVIPGIVDAHAHLLGLGTSLTRVQLAGLESYDSVVARAAERARTLSPGAWVLGRGWDQNRWPGKRFPTHDALSRAVPDHPVALERVDGHALLANAAAMRAARVTRATSDPPGGRIVRDGAGNPTGVFVDNAEALIERVVPPLSGPEAERAILAAQAECHRWGLVGVHDAGVGRTTLDLYERLAREGRLTLREYAMVSDDSADIAHYLARGPERALYGGHLWIRAIKLYADGALGSRGAALLAPYSDGAGNTGLLVSTPEHLRAVSALALRHGFQVATHAIGDRGNRVALDAYEAAFRMVGAAPGPPRDVRFRIEHAQVLSPEDIPRFARLGVIPSMQASHQTSDMPWAEARLGTERVRGAYAWRSLLDAGSIIPNGSDFPVEEVNPLLSFHAAVTRQNPSNEPPGGWYPAQRMTREEALRSMTLWPAYAAFQEHDLGSLTAGKYADFVVFDRDIMTAAPEDILKARVVATYVGGRAVYEAPAGGP